MKVVVLGAGVIGVTSAYFLARAGYKVTVIEKNSSVANGCSYGNGGQLSYSHIETWSSKSSILSIIKAALTPNSFVKISDFANQDFWRFAAEFYKNSNPTVAQENSQKIFALTSFSKESFAEIIKEEDLSFSFKKGGTLHFYRSLKNFEKAVKESEKFGPIGCKAQILTAEDCLKKEPALVKLFDEKKLAGGIFYEGDASGDCAAFTKALARVCKEKYGVVFEVKTEVKNILTNFKKITGINTDKGVFVGDAYVYCLGAHGVRFLNGINVASKIYPIKGHSISIACDQDFIAPTQSLTDPENKIVYSRLGDNFRVAGTVGFCKANFGVDRAQISFLKKTVCASFADFGNINKIEEWAGFRPFRPNSIPLICKVKKYGNLFVNSGHGSLGWTMSAGSGKILADVVGEKKGQKFKFLDEELA